MEGQLNKNSETYVSFENEFLVARNVYRICVFSILFFIPINRWIAVSWRKLSILSYCKTFYYKFTKKKKEEKEGK